MSIIHADNFSMYGTSTAPMLDGIYASVAGSLSTDPDGFSDGYVWHINSNNPEGVRYVLPAVNTSIGVAARIFPPSLNFAGNVYPAIAFKDAGSNTTALLDFDTTGRASLKASGVTLATTAVPVITANGWSHIECKATFGAGATDTFELRVNGVVRMSLTGINLQSDNIYQVQVGTPNFSGNSGASTNVYWKDLVIWDTNGTENNDFLGQVSVFWRKPVSTLAAGGWTSNAGADADSTLTKPRLANVLTASGVIVNGNQVRINNTYYNWTSGSVDAGTPAGTSGNPWLVALGGDAATSLANLYAAIGATGVAGTTYSTALTAHATATPFGLTDTTIAVIPTDGVTTSMTFSETGANTSWLSGSAFSYLVHDAIRMSAGYTPAVAATGTVNITGLPVANETVTINGQVYVFKAAAAGALEVTIGADANATGANLATKINANSVVVTANNVAGVVTLTAVSAGAAGNSITLAEAATNVTVSGATLTGGVNTIYPTPTEVQLEPLPDDVTTIRAVIPVVRAAKVDGGDGNLQVSFGISSPSYDDGPDTPITTAFTFWGNNTAPFVSELNPLTAARWTPGEFNLGGRIKLARTL